LALDDNFDRLATIVSKKPISAYFGGEADHGVNCASKHPRSIVRQKTQAM
jgi:hypothetical protein